MKPFVECLWQEMMIGNVLLIVTFVVTLEEMGRRERLLSVTMRCVETEPRQASKREETQQTILSPKRLLRVTTRYRAPVQIEKELCTWREKTGDILRISTGRLPGTCCTTTVTAIVDLDRVVPVPCLTGSNSYIVHAGCFNIGLVAHAFTKVS